MKVSIRKFQKEDIKKKVEWINNPENNRYLHYDLPLEYEKTLDWFEKNKDRTDRYDAVIECGGEAVGLIGLLSVDRKNSKAEYYISMGETSVKRKGVAFRASRLLLDYAFLTLRLNKVYAYTEIDNVPFQRLAESLGFLREGVLKADIYSRGSYVDRIVYGMSVRDFLSRRGGTPVGFFGNLGENRLYVKREDLIPFSFGGNKARKAKLFFEEVDGGGFDCVVTYGSGSSNHCRVVANMCAQRGLDCVVISPLEASERTFNSVLMDEFGARIICVPVSEVHDTIEKTLAELRSSGKNPFFIQGGGHGDTGTRAYRECYDEIKSYEAENNLFFDYIFFASGTGTTQAGLVCGQLIYGDDRKIVGISVARKNPYGRNVVLDSVRSFLKDAPEEAIQASTHFVDGYVGGGYGTYGDKIKNTVRRVMVKYGIPLDSTYTGKAFCGMEEYVKSNGISGKNILFIHTGGTPLFFDFLRGTHNI